MFIPTRMVHVNLGEHATTTINYIQTFTFEPGELGSCKNDDGTNNAEVLALAKACGNGKSIPEGDQCCLDYGCDADCQW